ncbi:DUF805 domain-containing protein [Marichromatium gracile]|uniref:DUF805 domain-containing protein n=1 Tax=Marichromatium gracile TaxID=1048 RepID=UPI001F17DD4B|nr:DUF805 domain-containing protein [Marichromatium gracile]MCF1184098.1 DUF805 domain-containing protein [Marichromatium gracile]
MLTIFFGDIKHGRLSRLAYLGCHAALIALLVLASFGLAKGPEDSALIADIKLAVLIAIAAVLLVAQANIAAKRIRDAGLPGWWILLLIALLSLAIGALFGHELIAGLDLLLLLLLLVLPTEAFGRREA